MKWISVTTALLLAVSSNVCAIESRFPTSWPSTKKVLAEKVYTDRFRTFYCGCQYTVDASSGRETLNPESCRLPSNLKWANKHTEVEWEHIVPAELMPASTFSCWQKAETFPRCVSPSGKVANGRACCEKVDTAARNMIFDMFNAVPAAAQLNQYRSNDPYGEISDTQPHEGFGPQCEAQDLNSPGKLFEPPDCKKGDVARVWFYMRDTHKVVIPNEMSAMFLRWSNSDPVSPSERLYAERISKIQGTVNSYVIAKATSDKGSCSWE